MLTVGDKVHSVNLGSHLVGELVEYKGQRRFVVRWTYVNHNGQTVHYYRDEFVRDLVLVKPKAKMDDSNPNYTFRMKDNTRYTF